MRFLPQFVDGDAPPKVLAFSFLGVLDFNGTLWNLFVAFCSAGAAIHKRRDLRLWIDRALGTLFIYIGIRLATVERW
jgi:threonine/homoserine/homoserine lactone efflux protein